MPRKVKNAPNEEQAKLFDQAVQKWQRALSLGDWRIEKGLKPARNAMATVEFDNAARLAIYRLGDFGAEQITPESLDKTALHELLHVLLHDLICTSQDRSATDEQLEAVEHRVINVLEKLLWEGTTDAESRC